MAIWSRRMEKRRCCRVWSTLMTPWIAMMASPPRDRAGLLSYISSPLKRYTQKNRTRTYRYTPTRLTVSPSSTGAPKIRNPLSLGAPRSIWMPLQLFVAFLFPFTPLKLHSTRANAMNSPDAVESSTIAEMEETIARISSHKGVEGVMIMDRRGAIWYCLP